MKAHSAKLIYFGLLQLSLSFAQENSTDTPQASTTIEPIPPGYERFANLELDDELDDDFTPIDKDYVKPITTKNADVHHVRTNFGLHLCTFRLCNCYISNCFAYCAWNWCYQKQDRFNQRYYLQCDTKLDPWDCPEFEHPCIKYC